VPGERNLLAGNELRWHYLQSHLVPASPSPIEPGGTLHFQERQLKSFVGNMLRLDDTFFGLEAGRVE
jgi:hypothetical protein